MKSRGLRNRQPLLHVALKNHRWKQLYRTVVYSHILEGSYSYLWAKVIKPSPEGIGNGGILHVVKTVV